MRTSPIVGSCSGWDAGHAPADEYAIWRLWSGLSVVLPFQQFGNRRLNTSPVVSGARPEPLRCGSPAAPRHDALRLRPLSCRIPGHHLQPGRDRDDGTRGVTGVVDDRSQRGHGLNALEQRRHPVGRGVELAACRGAVLQRFRCRGGVHLPIPDEGVVWERPGCPGKTIGSSLFLPHASRRALLQRRLRFQPSQPSSDEGLAGAEL
jgi:hypothetical protein